MLLLKLCISKAECSMAIIALLFSIIGVQGVSYADVVYFLGKIASDDLIYFCKTCCVAPLFYIQLNTSNESFRCISINHHRVSVIQACTY